MAGQNSHTLGRFQIPKPDHTLITRTGKPLSSGVIAERMDTIRALIQQMQTLTGLRVPEKNTNLVAASKLLAIRTKGQRPQPGLVAHKLLQAARALDLPKANLLVITYA